MALDYDENGEEVNTENPDPWDESRENLLDLWHQDPDLLMFYHGLEYDPLEDKFFKPEDNQETPKGNTKNGEEYE